MLELTRKSSDAINKALKSPELAAPNRLACSCYVRRIEDVQCGLERVTIASEVLALASEHIIILGFFVCTPIFSDSIAVETM
jgi:hypothetical protein